MTLVAARGPLSANPTGWFSPPLPGSPVFVEPHPRRVVACVAGRTVIDTERSLLVHRRGDPLSYAFPDEDVVGIASEPVPEAPGFARVSWDAVDEWFEEGRKLVNYPPNPYHRVDCLPTTRGLRASVLGAVLVDTVDTVVLFETAIKPRLYVHPSQVRTDLLELSNSTSYCNYKGWATFWSARIKDELIADVAWTYDDPPAESTPIRGFFSFDDVRADVIAELPPSRSGAADCGCQA